MNHIMPLQLILNGVSFEDLFFKKADVAKFVLVSVDLNQTQINNLHHFFT